MKKITNNSIKQLKLVKKYKNEIKGTTVEVKNVDLFLVLTYFNNCNKLVCTDVSCENVNIMSVPLKRILKTPGKEKNKIMNKIKEMRSKAYESDLRGGKKRNQRRKIKQKEKDQRIKEVEKDKVFFLSGKNSYI